MAPAHRRTLFSCLLLGAACRSQPAADDFILVVIESPASLEFDGFRLLKSVDGREGPLVDRTVGNPRFQHRVAISMPAKSAQIVLRVQAILERRAVAEGLVQIDESTSAPTVPLSRCAKSAPLGPTFVSCLEAGDGGVVDAGADGQDGSRDASTEGRDAWTLPASCADAGGAPDPFSVPQAPRPECQEYCRAMQDHCSSVYGTTDRCLFACETLAWPASGATPREDTVACRTSWATIVPQDELTRLNHCRYASPSDVVACGELCDVYCRSGARICGAHFPPEDVCREACLRRKKDLNELDPIFDLQTRLLCRLQRLQDAIFQRDLCVEAAPTSCGPCMPAFFDLPPAP